MRQLIVNADDFGLTQAVNAGILQSHFQGIVTSTTVMANGEAFDGVVSIRRRSPNLGIGVHLNLTGGVPLSPARSIPTLVDRLGRLYLSPGCLMRALALRQISLSEIEIELRAQIGKVRRAGIRPTHLDGHKHVHVLPGVAEIVIRLAKEFGVPSIRCPREPAPDPRALRLGRNALSAVVKQYLVGRAVSAFARRFAEQLTTAGLQCPANFCGLSQTGFLNLRSVLDIVGTLRDGVSELMCHPGYVDGELVDSGTRLLAQRELEVQALTSRMVRRVIVERGIELISYQGLAQPVATTHNQIEAVDDRRLVG